MSTPVADEFDDIARRLKELEREKEEARAREKADEKGPALSAWRMAVNYPIVGTILYPSRSPDDLRADMEAYREVYIHNSTETPMNDAVNSAHHWQRRR